MTLRVSSGACIVPRAVLPRLLPGLGLLAALGCSDPRPVAGAQQGLATCAPCHGSEASAAPAPDLLGDSEPGLRGVGAHAAHLLGGRLSEPIECVTCHVVPDTSRAPGHSDSAWPAEVTFSGLATTGGAAPVLDAPPPTGSIRDDRLLAVSCGDVYCHGAGLSGGTATRPVWNQPDPRWTTCDACHGAPPPPPHPAATECATCHAGYTLSSVNVASHVDGVVDVSASACTACHGDEARPATSLNPLAPAAPPRGTRSETLASQRAVGAHQAHLLGTSLGRPVPCSECHEVPSRTMHANGTVDLVFGPLARTGGAAPAWNGTTCASAYCHGNFPGGNTANAPTWTAATPVVCGSCHGIPPPPPHPAASDCSGCHPGYTASSVDVVRHVDGQVDVSAAGCTSCHGDPARSASAANPQLPAAPPRGTRGETAANQRAVGAHQAHLQGGAFSRAVACTECHTLPTRAQHANGTVDLVFGTLARTGGTSPVWNGTTCASSYCHGSFENGNAANTPVWTAAAPVVCGSCHGLPPGGTHPARTDCQTCHPGYTDSRVNLATHVNGSVELNAATCTSCHGDAARLATADNPQLPAAPPLGTGGETQESQRAVGAHLAHLLGGRFSTPVACTECHVVPTRLTHASGTVDVVFGTLARTGGAAPVWSGTTCASSYCHGNFAGGNTANAPSWTAAIPVVCGSCHGTPPPPPHPVRADCETCHPGYTASDVDVTTHLDGRVDVEATCTSCHGDEARAASAANPQRAAAPPQGTGGETLATQRAVGAHEAHLLAGRFTGEIACTECHVVPSSTDHENGVVELTFGPLARARGATPAWTGTTCTSAYCHGGFPGGNTANAPTWTAPGSVACGSCHRLPPATGRHSLHIREGYDCVRCHGTGYSNASKTVNAALHINGSVQVGGAGSSVSSYSASTRRCSPSCHESEQW